MFVDAFFGFTFSFVAFLATCFFYAEIWLADRAEIEKEDYQGSIVVAVTSVRPTTHRVSHGPYRSFWAQPPLPR